MSYYRMHGIPRVCMGPICTAPPPRRLVMSIRHSGFCIIIVMESTLYPLEAAFPAEFIEGTRFVGNGKLTIAKAVENAQCPCSGSDI